MKKLLVALVFTFLFCFGGLVFAQNTNSSTTMQNSNTGMMGRHRHRKHHRRHGRHMRRAAKNANM